MRKEDLILMTLTIMSVLVIVVIFVTQAYVTKACLERGYREGKFDFTFTMYCVKRVDQTDVVTPLEEL